MDSTGIRAQHKQYLWPCTTNYYQEPIVLVEGRGVVVRDLEGREYLDFFGGILTTSVGHGIPEITRAVHEQVDRLLHTSTLYPAVPVVGLAARLAGIAPPGLSQVFFTPSGTDADETAAMIAQAFTGRQDIIALRHCYSGRSYFAQSITGHAPWRSAQAQVSFVRHAHAPYCYRCDFGLAYPSCDLHCATDIESLIRTTTGGAIAALIAEPILGVGGFIVPPAEYFRIAVDIARRYGGLFICDEVQTGFGRTGGKLWGIEHSGVVPDVMTVAKGIANGLPLAATLTRPEVAQAWKGLSISTFGGNPVACAAGLATVDYIIGKELPDHVTEMGAALRDGLLSLQRDFPRLVGDVRGKGLMQAIEVVVDEAGGDRTPNPQAVLGLFEATKRRGLLLGKGGLYGNTIRISPPMTVSREEIEDAVRILGEAVAEVSSAM
jgi:alanine-glyoxylate transaminase/(R)-3-amino-2-methylpropionate-pyruvate transaminase